MAELDVVVSALLEVLDFLFRQPMLVKSVTYTSWTKPQFDEATRTMKEVSTATAVDAINVGAVIGAFGEGNLPFGSAKVDFIFRASSLSGPPSVRDKVTVDGTVRQVSGMVPYLNQAYGVTLEGTS
jgi:hypothetical protein